jgi:hypothetical protein
VFVNFHKPWSVQARVYSFNSIISSIGSTGQALFIVQIAH